MSVTNQIGIMGTGIYFPSRVLPVSELVKRHNYNSKEMLAEHGVKKIHVAGKHDDEFSMAVDAAKAAIKDANLSTKDIDMVIYCRGASVHPNPRSLSSCIIEKLNIGDSYGFDVEGGFIGGLIGIQVAKDIIQNKDSTKHALVVASHRYDTQFFYSGEISRIRGSVFGDGAAALVLSQESTKNDIISSNFLIDHYTSYFNNIIANPSIPGGLMDKLGQVNLLKKIQLKAAFQALVERSADNSAKTILKCIKSVNLGVSDINHFVKTQLSIRETEILASKLKINSPIIYNASAEKGHLGHADMLCNLHISLKEAKLTNMDIIVLVSTSYDCSSGVIVLRR